VFVVTAAVRPTSSRRGSAVGGGVTSDDDVDGHMTKTDTCFSLLSPDISTIPSTGNHQSADVIQQYTE